MFKTILRAYRWEYTVAIACNLLIVALQLISPFLLKRVIIFIRFREEDTLTGLLLVLALPLT